LSYSNWVRNYISRDISLRNKFEKFSILVLQILIVPTLFLGDLRSQFATKINKNDHFILKCDLGMWDYW